MTQVRGASLLETLMGPSELNAAVQHVCVESTDLNRHHPFGSMLAACPRLHSLHLAVEPTRLPDALTSDSDTISFGKLRQLSFDPCMPWHPPLVPAPSLPIAVLAVFPPSLRRLELHLGSCSGALETHSLLFDHDKSPRVQLPCLRELRIVMRPDRLSFDLVASIVVAMSGKRVYTLDLAFVPLQPHEIPLESLAAIPGVLVSFQHIKHLRLTCALRHVPASRSRSETLSFLADLTDACPSLITLALDRSTYQLAFSTPSSVQVLQLEYLAAGQLRAQEDCPDRAVINSGQLMRACQGILSSSNGSLAGVHTLVMRDRTPYPELAARYVLDTCEQRGMAAIFVSDS